MSRAAEQLRERLAQRLRAEWAKLNEDLAHVLDEPLWAQLDVAVPGKLLHRRGPVRWLSNASPGFSVSPLFWDGPSSATVRQALAQLEPHAETLAAEAATAVEMAAHSFATEPRLVDAMLEQKWLAERLAWPAWPCTDTPLDTNHPEFWGERAAQWKLWCVFTMLRVHAWPIRWERAAHAASGSTARTGRPHVDQDPAMAAFWRESAPEFPSEVAPAAVTASVVAARAVKDDPTGVAQWHDEDEHQTNRRLEWIELCLPGDRSTTVLGCNVALLFLAERDLRTDTKGAYRFPTVVLPPIHRALGGKRQGKDHGIKVKPNDELRIVSLRVEGPNGFTLDLFSKPDVIARPEDYDESGAITPEAVWRLVGEATGPAVSMMGHVAFSLAHRHAAETGRRPDGRFWFSPSETADLLGYKRESNGKASKNRISREATPIVRDNFMRYANAILHMKAQLPDGSEHKIDGPLLYPTKLEHSWREPGQKGRDKREEWRIRDELWTLMERNHIWIPEDMLNSGDTRPDTWAHCIRLYEVLATHARRCASTAGSGEPLTLSFEVILRDANLAGPKVPERNARAQLMKYLERLAGRGFVRFKVVTLKDGRPGIRYTLPEPRQMEMGQVASRHRTLAAQAPRPKPGGGRKKP